MSSFLEWSTTAASNSSVGGIYYAEGQNSNTVNNSAREMMKQLADVRDGNVVSNGWHVAAAGLVIHDTTDQSAGGKTVSFDLSEVGAGSATVLTLPGNSGTLVTADDFPSINSKPAETVPAAGDLFPFHSASAGAERKITLGDLMKVIISLTAESTISGANDFLPLYDADEGAANRVTPNALARGYVLLDSKTASSSATLDFDDHIDNSFASYRFEIVGVYPATDAAILQMRFSTDGGSNYAAGASDYTWAYNVTTSAGTNAPQGDTADAQIKIAGGQTSANATGLAGHVDIYNPASGAVNKLVNYVGTYVTNAGATSQVTGGGNYIGSTSAVNAVRFMFSTGNISGGTIYLYGLRSAT